MRQSQRVHRSLGVARSCACRQVRESGFQRRLRLCDRWRSIHTRDQAYEIGQLARAKKKVVIVSECFSDRLRDRWQVERAAAKFAFKLGDRERVCNEVPAQPQHLDCLVTVERDRSLNRAELRWDPILKFQW